MFQAVSILWAVLKGGRKSAPRIEHERKCTEKFQTLKSVYIEPQEKVQENEQANLYQFGESLEEVEEEALNFTGSFDSDRDNLKLNALSGSQLMNEKQSSFKMKSSGLFSSEKLTKS